MELELGWMQGWMDVVFGVGNNDSSELLEVSFYTVSLNSMR